MPIYEFVCSDCQKKFEDLVRSESDTVSCPGCGSRRLTKAFSAFAVSAKGGAVDAAEWESGSEGPGGGGCPPEGCHSCRD